MEKVLIKEKQSFKYSLKKRFISSRFLIIMIIPAIIFYAIFNYIPMYGVLLAFSKYSPRLGLIGSVFQNWIGFDNFQVIFNYEGFWIAFRNTLIIGTIKIVISFVSAVTVALLINEIRMRYFKKVVQIIVTFPHFLSWVIVASLFILLFSDSGSINHMIAQAGGSKINLFSDGKLFLGLIFSSDIWKEAGSLSHDVFTSLASLKSRHFPSHFIVFHTIPSSSSFESSIKLLHIPSIWSI